MGKHKGYEFLFEGVSLENMNINDKILKLKKGK